MKFETYNTPDTRSEFEHRFHILSHLIKTDRFHVSPSVSMEGVMLVRNLPNGRIDFLSVNESARLQANMMLMMSKIPMPD